MTRRIKLLLITVGMLAVAVLVFFLVINPIRGEISKLQVEVEQEEGRISKAKIELAAAEATRAEGRRNQARLLELAKMVPLDTELPSLVLQIQDLADKSGITWIRITPGETKDGGTGAYLILPLSLEFSGSYYDVSDFIYRAEQMIAGPGRLLAIKSLGLTVGQASEGSSVTAGTVLDVSISLYAFIVSGTWGVVPDTTPATGTTETGGTTQ